MEAEEALCGGLRSEGVVDAARPAGAPSSHLSPCGRLDTVNHDKLLTQLRAKIGGGKLLRLIGRYLRAGVELPDGSRETTPLGVPQGGPLSPLLAKLIQSPPAPSPLWGSLSAVCLAASAAARLCLIHWTRNSNAAGIISPAMPTTS